MKHLLLTTIAAVLVVGCGPPKPPDISIHNAVIFGNIQAVKQHLAAGTDVDMKGNLRETPLFRAFERQNIKMAKLLVDNGADVNAKEGGYGGTPMHLAAAIFDKQFAELLISNGAKVNVKTRNYRFGGPPWAPIHLAAFVGNKDLVELLITKGVDVNTKDEGGWTPLRYAVGFTGDTEIAELLIANGADVNAKDEDGWPPLDAAIINDLTEIADLLRKHGGKSGANDSIHIAASVGNIEAVKQHLASGSDVNVKDKFGSTPMHKAARFGQKEVSELLIEKGADLNAKDEDGQTPLDGAIQFKNTKTADLLRKHGGKTGEELKAEGK